MSSPSLENISPQVISRVSREIRELVRSPPEGVQYVENEDDNLGEIFANMSGPEGTPYEGGMFRVKIVLSEDYPASPPKGYFLTPIFHPNVAEAGDICVNTLKRDWGPKVTMSKILQVVRCLLIVPFPESALNDEAGRMFMDSYEEYAARARLMTSVHAATTGGAGGGGGGEEGGGDEAKSQSGESSTGKSNEGAALTANGSGKVKSVSKGTKKKKKGLNRL